MPATESRIALGVVVICLIASGALAPSALRAQASEECETCEEKQPERRKPRGSPEGLEREARSIFEAGRIAFKEGRYENAYDYFKRAHEVSEKPLLLYNMGLAADRLRKNREALEHFRAYLEKVPDAPNRAEVQSRVEVLERVVNQDDVSRPTRSEAAGGEREDTDAGGDAKGEDDEETPPERSQQDGESTEPVRPAASPERAGGTGTPDAPPERGQRESKEPEEPTETRTRTGAEQAKDVRLQLLVYGAVAGRWNASSSDGLDSASGKTDPEPGFEVRIGFPFVKYAGVGILVRPAAFWSAKDQRDGRSYYFDLGPYFWGGYPITLGEGYLMPFAAFHVGGTAGVLSGLADDFVSSDDNNLGAGWTVSAMLGAEWLINTTFAVTVDFGFVQHSLTRGEDMTTREMLINAGIGFVL